MVIRKKIARKTVIVLLGVTKIISSTQRTLPGKWHNIIDSIKVSSQTAHLKLIEIDQDAAAEFYDMEEELKRKIGRGSLYTEEDLNTARRRVESVRFESVSDN